MASDDDDGCRVCGTHVQLNFNMDWPDGRPICWSCLWEERTELLAACQKLLSHIDRINPPSGAFRSGAPDQEFAREAIAKAFDTPTPPASEADQ